MVIKTKKGPVKPVPLTWQFVEGRSWTSRLIAWFGYGAGGYSHVDFVLPTGWLLGEYENAIRHKNIDGDIEHIPAGMQVRPPGYANWKKRDRIKLWVTPDVAQAVEKQLRSNIGEAYDMAAIYGLIADEDWHQPGAYFCSARQVSTLMDTGVIHDTGCQPWHITPDTLAVILCAIGGEKESLTP